MTRTLFDEGWEFSRTGSDDWAQVDLPHDAMLHEERDGSLTGGHHTGWYPGGSYTYRKTWQAPPTPEVVALLFEGVYRSSRVLVNGTDVGGCLPGYTEFQVDLTPHVRWGAENLIEVTVDNSETPNSRWYTGSGIYRHVWLLERPTALGFARDGVRLVTRTLTSAQAVADLQISLEHVTGPVRLEASLVREGSPVAEASIDTTRPDVSLELAIADPRPWSAETPHLYDLVVVASVDGTEVDRYEHRVGLRTVAANAGQGFLVNGTRTLLRGACIHHDNGVLGAATFRDAEYRRARILKEQGFNAVRSAHNPLSRDFLDAADELGLYVMDELWDSWLDQKTAHDIAGRFHEVWQHDVAAMVAKDRNHASVVMYSTGNEVGESGRPDGIEVARKVADELRTLDPTRLVTSGINPMLNMATLKGKNPALDENQAVEDPKRKNALQSEGFNQLMNRLGDLMLVSSALPAAGRAVEGVAATLDVVGYNYGTGRYLRDRKRFPDRVIVGTETMPFHIAKNWALVEQHPHIVGDFMWTGWDYLGEAGIGAFSYGDEPAGMRKPYPYLLAGPGAIDLLGDPGAPMLLARAVWGVSGGPQIAVRPVDKAGQRTNKVGWRRTDALPSWAWAGCEGNRAEVEVYSAADEVELLVNGRSVGRRKAGKKHGFTATFRGTWVPGELTAVAYTHGRESGRATLRSTAGPVSVRLSPERTDLDADGQSLAYVRVELADDHGTVSMTSDTEVTVTVAGPATLAGLGSADPAPTLPYTGDRTRTWRGRALAIIRAGQEPGDVTVSVDAGALGSATTTLRVR